MLLIHTFLTCYYNTSLEDGLGRNAIPINHQLIKKKEEKEC
jgi:hypothetical protein